MNVLTGTRRVSVLLLAVNQQKKEDSIDQNIFSRWILS